MICFLLQGATTKEAPTTLMAVHALRLLPRGRLPRLPRRAAPRRSSTRSCAASHDGCHLMLNAHVDKVEVEDGRAVGVRVGGRLVRARKAVVSNADLWSTSRLVDAAAAPALSAELGERSAAVGRCASFLHLHLGIDAAGLPTTPSEAFPAQWAALDSWEAGVDAPRNLVLVSVPSLLDPSLAPEGRHVGARVRASDGAVRNWEGMSKEYREAKASGRGALARHRAPNPDVRDADITRGRRSPTSASCGATAAPTALCRRRQRPAPRPVSAPGLFAGGLPPGPGSASRSGLICAASLSSVRTTGRPRYGCEE